MPDLRYGLRSLAKSRAFTAAAILTLALGIGASTAIYSVIQNVLMTPFPYKGADRLYAIAIHDDEESQRGGRPMYQGPEVLAWGAQDQVFDGLAAMLQQDILYRTDEGTEPLNGYVVNPGTFEFFGMQAMYGRAMVPSDYEPGAPPVFVMRHKLWVSRFNADKAILNKTFMLSGTARTLIGIMPPRFAWGNADLWIPGKPAVAVAPMMTELPKYWYVVGRLRPEVSIAEAETRLNPVAQRLAKDLPREYPKQFSVRLESLAEQVVGDFRATLYVVLAAVGLLLLIACANVANLLLARAAVREKEIAVRSALGAGRGRLIRQLFVESLLLALGGALLGALFAWSGLKLMIAFIPPSIIPAESSIRLNGPVLLFTLLVAMATALIFGLVPALQLARRDLNSPLRDGSKGAGGGFRSGRTRDAIVVAEVAVSLTLLVGAGLLMRSFAVLRDVRLGIDPTHILNTRLPLPAERYHTGDQLASFYRPLLDRLKALPGVEDAAECSNLPVYGGFNDKVEIAGQVADDRRTAQFQLVSEDYLRLLRMRMLAGRMFDAGEVNAKRRLAVVNKTFADKYFGKDDPLGRNFRLPILATIPDPVAEPTFEIVGVVADARNRGLQEPIQPEVWLPYTITGAGDRGILVRTTGEPMALAAAVRREIWGTNAAAAVTPVRTLESYLGEFSYAGPRFGMLLMGLFAAVGLVLVTVGVYSVIAYAIARQTREIGIRVAIGAQRADVLRLVMSKGLRLVAIGVSLGLVATLAIARVIASQMIGVSPRDPATLAAVVAVLFAAGIAACFVPARRATQLDPVQALRSE